MTTDAEAAAELIALADELLAELRAGGVASLNAVRLATKLRRALIDELGVRNAAG